MSYIATVNNQPRNDTLRNENKLLNANFLSNKLYTSIIGKWVVHLLYHNIWNYKFKAKWNAFSTNKFFSDSIDITCFKNISYFCILQRYRNRLPTRKQDILFTKIPFTALLKTYSRLPILTLTFGQVLQLCLHAHGNMTNVLEIHSEHYSLDVTSSNIHQFLSICCAS